MQSARPANFCISFASRLLCRALCVVALVGLALAAGCRGGSKAPSDTLLYGRGSDADSLDPIDSNSGETAKVLVNIYDTLVTYADDSMEIVPSLAKSWESSDDGLTWTFQLRDDVKFHDGTPFNADAAVFSLQRLIDPENEHTYGATLPYQSHFANVERVRKIDDSTIEFTLREPSSVFLQNLAMFSAGIVSPRAVEKYGDEFKLNPVGTGPFQLQNWKRGVEIVLAANEDYFRGAPGLNRVIFIEVPDNSVRAQKLLHGELHIADNLPPEELDALEAAEGISVQRQMGLNVGYLATQLEKPPLDNHALRLAIAHAIDKEGLIESAYSGRAVPATTVVAPTIDGHAVLEDYPYDPERARQLLEQAAEEEGFTLPLKLRLYVMDQARPYIQQPKQTAAYIKDSLQEIGINVEIVTGLVPQYFQQLSNGEHELGLIGWSSEKNSADDILGSLLVSDAIGEGGNNNSRYNNPEFDALVAQARAETDDARRQELYKQAQELVLADAPVIPLVHTEVGIAQSSQLQGYDLHPLSIVRLRLAHFGEED